LEFVQEQYIGQLPSDAVDIEYAMNEQRYNYALLSFTASPISADEFVSRFCFNFLYQGFDPFNAIDDLEGNTGFLIRTNPSYYYYSKSPNTPPTIFGNRCFHNQQGGLLQIRIDRSNPDYYHVKLEISAYCENRDAPHPCEGRHIVYRDLGGIAVDSAPIVLEPRIAHGQAWQVSLESDATYALSLLPIEREMESEDHIGITILPGALAECESCRVVAQTNIGIEGLQLEFAGSTVRQATIRIFWMTESDQRYELRVSRR